MFILTESALQFWDIQFCAHTVLVMTNSHSTVANGLNEKTIFLFYYLGTLSYIWGRHMTLETHD